MFPFTLNSWACQLRTDKVIWVSDQSHGRGGRMSCWSQLFWNFTPVIRITRVNGLKYTASHYQPLLKELWGSKEKLFQVHFTDNYPPFQGVCLGTPPSWLSLPVKRRWTASLHKASRWGQTPLVGRPTREPIKTGWAGQLSRTQLASGAAVALEARPAEAICFGEGCPSTPACGDRQAERMPVWLGAPPKLTPCCLEIC